MEIPHVRFIYAYPLDNNRRRLYSEKGLGYYPSIDQVREKIGKWEVLWNTVNADNRVILKLLELGKRTPERSLECYIFGAGLNPMSAPLMVPVMRKDVEYSDEEFIEILIHEIAHVFVGGHRPYFKMIVQKYPTETTLVHNHIIIYALLEKIYSEMFKSKLGDFGRTDLPSDYARAIEIVKEKGHENLLREYQETL